MVCNLTYKQWYIRFGQALPARALVALLGLSSIAFAPGCSKTVNAALQKQADDKPAKVVTKPVTARSVPVWLSLTGQLKGRRDADLAANVNGKVIKTLVERGDVVKVGQPLAVVDTRAASLSYAEARASAESAAAAAENAKLNCERFRVLAEQGSISQFEYDANAVRCRTSDLSVSAARARAELANQHVGDGIIRAPFAGSIAERYVDVGEFVRSDSRVVTLIDLSTLRLEFTLPEAQIAAARPGTKVRFGVAGYPSKIFSGTVKYVSAQVRPTTRDVVAEALVDTPNVDLRPGMFAAVKLEAGTRELPVIASRSLLERDGKSVVFVEVGGRLEERIVHVDETMGEEKSIARGIVAGDKLVVVPTPELKNGQPHSEPKEFHACNG
jgi:membrane fusion protein (multidrug efflux system)